MYISGIGNISPQHSYDNHLFLEEIRSFPGNRLSCTEPDYKHYIGPVQIRRMGRIVKMGISSAKIALDHAGVAVPDAIIVGTGLGCLEDTEKFLRIMLDDAEQTAAPTPFISSTHNSVAGAIALQIKCLGYNYTYVHKGFSFISCLYDAALQMRLGQARHVLVGGIDEMTDSRYLHNGLIGYWNTSTPDTAGVFQHPAAGSLAGEGSAFFLLSAEKQESSYARIIGFRQVLADSAEDVVHAFDQLLLEHGLKGERFVLLEGKSGNVNENPFYDAVEQAAGSKAPNCSYKHLCGTYHTTDAFGLWVAANIVKHGRIPDALHPSAPAPHPTQVVVLYDYMGTGEHVFQIISA